MRFLRFLVKELVLHGVLFAVVGTVALSSLYLLAIGASGEEFIAAGKSFLMLISGREDYSVMRAGFTSGQIIASGAAVTLPLALISLIFVIIISLVGASFSVTSRYMAVHFGAKGGERFTNVVNLLFSVLAAVPLFVGFWVAYAWIGSVNFLFIALMTVICGGLSWDATNFLKTDMLSQVEQTHAIVFSTLGRSLGRFFPVPGTYSGYLFQSSLPRYIPYLAGKVPAIIGSVTIAEIAYSFPGLGSTLIDALIDTNTNLLVTSVFILLCVNAVVSFLVKAILFLIYPRWYEKAI